MTDARRINERDMSDNNCFYCGTALQRSTPVMQRPNDRTRDHIEPKCKGGRETVWCCRVCNFDKGHLTLQEYRMVIMYRRGLINREMIIGGVLFWGENQ